MKDKKIIIIIVSMILIVIGIMLFVFINKKEEEKVIDETPIIYLYVDENGNPSNDINTVMYIKIIKIKGIKFMIPF